MNPAKLSRAELSWRCLEVYCSRGKLMKRTSSGSASVSILVLVSARDRAGIEFEYAARKLSSSSRGRQFIRNRNSALKTNFGTLLV